MNIIGMPLFTDYYSIHDPITGTVSWAPHSASTKANVKTGTTPSSKQYLEVGRVSKADINQAALYISWALTGLAIYLVLDYWGTEYSADW